MTSPDPPMLDTWTVLGPHHPSPRKTVHAQVALEDPPPRTTGPYTPPDSWTRYPTWSLYPGCPHAETYTIRELCEPDSHTFCSTCNEETR